MHKTLYEHIPHEHVHRNSNRVHEQEQMRASLNQRIALLLARSVSSMFTAYLFTLLAFVGLAGLLGWLNPFVFLLTTWISQQFLQLVYLPILSVESSVIERKQHIQAEETYQTEIHILHNQEQMELHANAQDAKLIEIEERQIRIEEKQDRILTRLEQLPVPKTAKKTEVAK